MSAEVRTQPTKEVAEHKTNQDYQREWGVETPEQDVYRPVANVLQHEKQQNDKYRGPDYQAR